MPSFQDIKRAVFWCGFQIVLTPVNQLKLTLKSLQLLITRRKPKIIITRWFGRTGNNIQQILIALAHAEALEGALEITGDNLDEAGLSDLLSPIKMDFDPERQTQAELKSKFFFFTEYAFNKRSLKRTHFDRDKNSRPVKECLLSRGWIESNIHRIAQEYLKGQLIVRSGVESPGNSLVLCLRSGELQDLNNTYYITNPLCFYKKLSALFGSVIIITEPGKDHVLLRDICRLFREHRIVFTKHEDRDTAFELMRQAVYLATSGVSVFPMAAALLSDKLKTLYCTDAFMDEHLNPTMIDRKRVDVQMTKLPGFAEKWRTSKDRKKLLLNYDCDSNPY